MRLRNFQWDSTKTDRCNIESCIDSIVLKVSLAKKKKHWDLIFLHREWTAGQYVRAILPVNGVCNEPGIRIYPSYHESCQPCACGGSTNLPIGSAVVAISGLLRLLLFVTATLLETAYKRCTSPRLLLSFAKPRQSSASQSLPPGRGPPSLACLRLSRSKRKCLRPSPPYSADTHFCP